MRLLMDGWSERYDDTRHQTSEGRGRESQNLESKGKSKIILWIVSFHFGFLFVFFCVWFCDAMHILYNILYIHALSDGQGT